MKAINPYLVFPGNTEEAFNFYKSVLGGEFVALQRFKEMPGAEKLSAENKEKILHISLEVMPGYILMASDSVEGFGSHLNSGNNFIIGITPDSREETENIFNALSEGGKISMPLQDMFWGAYYGDFTDKFGIRWMVNFQNSSGDQ